MILKLIAILLLIFVLRFVIMLLRGVFTMKRMVDDMQRQQQSAYQQQADNRQQPEHTTRRHMAQQGEYVAYEEVTSTSTEPAEALSNADDSSRQDDRISDAKFEEI